MLNTLTFDSTEGQMKRDWKSKDIFSYVILGIASGGLFGDPLLALKEKFGYSDGVVRVAHFCIGLLIALGWNLLGSEKSRVAKAVRRAILVYAKLVAGATLIFLPLAITRTLDIPPSDFLRASIVGILGLPVVIVGVVIWSRRRSR